MTEVGETSRRPSRSLRSVGRKGLSRRRRRVRRRLDEPPVTPAGPLTIVLQRRNGEKTAFFRSFSLGTACGDLHSAIATGKSSRSYERRFAFAGGAGIASGRRGRLVHDYSTFRRSTRDAKSRRFDFPGDRTTVRRTRTFLRTVSAGVPRRPGRNDSFPASGADFRPRSPFRWRRRQLPRP